MSRNFHEGSRSVAYSDKAMVATSHPLASLAARDCMLKGGNAIDAAIVASAVLCVVEPQSTGIGGDCFALIKKAGQDIKGFNGSGYAGSKANIDQLLKAGQTEISINSGQSVTVPGAIDAWDQLLNDFGTISLSEALKPAQKLAAEGFVVLPRVAHDWKNAETRLLGNENAKAQMLQNDKAPVAGDFHQFPKLAKALQMIIDGGRDEFYKGKIAQDIIKTLDQNDGFLTLEDLADYKGEYVTPIKGQYKGHEVVELPPNGHGITAIIILNILAKFNLEQYEADSAIRYHIHMEATRIAYALRDIYVGDPKFNDLAVDALMSDELATNVANQIKLDQANENYELPELQTNNTVYLSVTDQEGNAISFINSTFEHFGSCVVTDETGIALQCRGAGFNLKKGHVNQLEPRKRPMHTIIPAMLLKDGELKMSFGVMGGAYQPCGHAFTLSNILDYGMDIQQAIDFPRIFFKDKKLGVEDKISENTRQLLISYGHQVENIETPWGGAQFIEITHKNQKLIYKGATESRKDGLAIGL